MKKQKLYTENITRQTGGKRVFPGPLLTKYKRTGQKRLIKAGLGVSGEGFHHKKHCCSWGVGFVFGSGGWSVDGQRGGGFFRFAHSATAGADHRAGDLRD